MAVARNCTDFIVHRMEPPSMHVVGLIFCPFVCLKTKCFRHDVVFRRAVLGGRCAPSDEVKPLGSGRHRRELTAPGGQAALALASECAPTALGFSGRASQNSFHQRNQGGRSQMSISNGAHTHASTSPRPRNGCAVPPLVARLIYRKATCFDAAGPRRPQTTWTTCKLPSNARYASRAWWARLLI